jgi:dTDP-glucose 4,6-dehydratase
VNSGKARALGWSPRVTFEEGLARSVAWYREHQAWWRNIKDGSYREYYRQTYANR